MPHNNETWCDRWFDSYYYQLLYQDRNLDEAEYFANHLIALLKPLKGARMLDLACGRGRYSIYLNRCGFDVCGTDASHSAISYARNFENESLRFYMQDMRSTLHENYFEYIFSFFTSFGYFETDEENELVVQSIYKSLSANGIFVLDFMNIARTLKEIVSVEQKTAGGILFHIKRFVKDDFLIKKIEFEDQGHPFEFEEKIRLYDKSRLEQMFKRAGFELVNVFGDYHLNSFDAEQSDRLIFILQKPSRN